MSQAKHLIVALLALAVLAVTGCGSDSDPTMTSQPDQAEPVAAQLASTRQSPPEATYVGRQVCKECHEENFELHAKSGHASTFFHASDPQIAEKFAGQDFDAGDLYGAYRYYVDDEGLHARRLDGDENETIPLQYALGSGEHGITMLSLFEDEATGEPLGIEHRVTWFGTDKQLGHTPGHDYVPVTELEMFGMAHRGEDLQGCVGCHSTTGKVVGKEIVDHTPNVNCEKCHGPGSVHVAQARASDSPPPFSVGRVDWNVEQEFRLCGSCHRLPDDVTRKKLREYGADLNRFQPVGLLRSKCYLESDFQLGCTHCHNPHMATKQKTKAAYQQDCIDCHQENHETHVACPVSPADGCIECHMKATKVDHGIAFHDHWIRVHPE